MNGEIATIFAAVSVFPKGYDVFVVCNLYYFKLSGRDIYVVGALKIGVFFAINFPDYIIS